MFVRPVFLSFKLLIHYLVETSTSGGTVVLAHESNLSFWDVPPSVTQPLLEGT